MRIQLSKNEYLTNQEDEVSPDTMFIGTRGEFSQKLVDFHPGKKIVSVETDSWYSPVGWPSISEELLKFFNETGYEIKVMPSLVYFKNAGSEVQEISWNDKLRPRSLSSRLLLHTKNFAVNFTGENIPGICTVGKTQYEKGGKWSNTTYQIFLHPGVKQSPITQDWNSGKYINNFISPNAMQKDLGLEGLNPQAFRTFMKQNFPKSWEKHQTLMTQIQEFEEIKGNEDAIEYIFPKISKITRRKGGLQLLIDGEVWSEHYRPMKTVVTILQSLSSEYKLLISADADIEELTEDGFDGEDHLTSRGYVFDGEKGWVKPDVIESSSGNNPFEGLSKLI